MVSADGHRKGMNKTFTFILANLAFVENKLKINCILFGYLCAVHKMPIITTNPNGTLSPATVDRRTHTRFWLTHSLSVFCSLFWLATPKKWCRWFNQTSGNKKKAKFLLRFHIYWIDGFCKFNFICALTKWKLLPNEPADKVYNSKRAICARSSANGEIYNGHCMAFYSQTETRIELISIQ